MVNLTQVKGVSLKVKRDILRALLTSFSSAIKIKMKNKKGGVPMANESLKKLPNGKWQCEYEDKSGKKVTKLIEAGSEEEAERLAAAYLEKAGVPVRKIARGNGDKTKSSLI